MTGFDGEKFGNEVVDAVKGYVERETKALREQISALERRLAEVEKKGLASHG